MLLLIVTFGILFFLTRRVYRKGKSQWDKYNGIEGWFARIIQNEIYAVTGGENGNILFFFGELSYADIDPVTGEVVAKNTIILHPVDQFIRKQFNRVFIGPPYAPWSRQVKKLEIDRVTVKSTELILGKTDQYLADKLKAETKREGGLYGRFTRIQLAPDIDLGSNFRVEIMTTAFCEVFNAAPIFEVHSKDFLQLTSRIINAYIDALVRNSNWEEFKRKIGSTLDPADLVNINNLLKRVGIRVNQITLDDWGISKSSKPVQDALEEERIAKAKAEAAIRTAEGKARSIEIEADAENYRLKKVGEGTKLSIMAEAEGEAERVRRIAEQYIAAGMNAHEAGKRANEQIINRDKWGSLGNLTTLVDGNTSGTIVSLGGKDGSTQKDKQGNP